MFIHVVVSSDMTTQQKIKVIDYKKLRDEAIEAMIKFRKMGDMELANHYFTLAAHIQSIRTDIDTMKLPKDNSLI